MGFTRWIGRAFRSVGRAGQRAITSLPWNVGGPRNSAVVSTEKALSLIPFFACVRLLADSVASLPLQAFRQLGDTRQHIPDPQLIQQPSARGTLFDWLHRCVVSLALRGNAYGLVVARDRMGFPTTIEWLNPDEVYVDETNPAFPRYFWLGHPIPAEEIVHIAWFVLPGRVVGLSPVSAFASSIGVGLSATQFGGEWFDAGGTPPGTFKNSQQTVGQTEADEIKERLVSAIRSRKPIVYGKDWDFKALSVSPEESQFIETMKINATQMAAIFGVDPEEVGGERGGSLTYNNLEQDSARFARRTLRPWLVRLESVFSTWLPDPEYVRFNLDAFVRADLKTRYEAHHLALDDGWRTVDEVRAIEDLPPLEGSDPQQELLVKLVTGAPSLAPLILPLLGFELPAVPPDPTAPPTSRAGVDPTWDYDLPSTEIIPSVRRNGHKPDPVPIA